MSIQSGREKNPPIERGPKTDSAANKPNGNLKMGGNKKGFKAGKQPGGKK